jgi:carboxyl-terminal processing protease
MNKTSMLAAIFAVLTACAYKLPEVQVLRIFERHSFKEHDLEKLRVLIKEKGLAGLQLEDKYAAVVRSKRRIELSREKKKPSTGILVGAKGGSYFLLKIFKGSPAEAAGLKDADKVLSLNSAAPGSEEFFKALSGKQEFALKVSRRSKEGVSEMEADVKGGEFFIAPVFGFYEPESRSAFVRIGLFPEDSAAVAASGLAGMQRFGVKNVILDLRGNLGGIPGEAAALLELFAPRPGPVMAISSRHKGYTQVFEAKSRGRFAGMRIAVLVDQATSMAGEVFAASLKELAGATVIGGKTAGNVSLQKTFSLGEGRGLTLTIAHLVSLSGNDLEGVGLTPDVPVEAAGGPAWHSVPADVLLKDPVHLRALEFLAKAR